MLEICLLLFINFVTINGLIIDFNASKQRKQK